MPNLEKFLKNRLKEASRVAILAIGSEFRSDDAAGLLVAENLKKQNLNIKEATLAYLPKEELTLTNPEEQEKIEKLYNLIDNLDDITNIYTNANW